MNRIILIDNGFDLAQDLKTSHKDFIDDYLNKKSEEIIKTLKYNISLHHGTIPLKPYEDIVVEFTNNTSVFRAVSGRDVLMNTYHMKVLVK